MRFRAVLVLRDHGLIILEDNKRFRFGSLERNGQGLRERLREAPRVALLPAQGSMSTARSLFGNLRLLRDGLPGTLITVVVLAAHEVGHILVARNVGAKLGVPYFIPSWQVSIPSSYIA
eukprot:Gb_19505 [translate_table: standard]